MNKSLFFLPILARAFRQLDPEQAWKSAFDQIRELGRQKAYRAGLRQFEQFMTLSAQYAQDNADRIKTMADVLGRELAVELAAGAFAGDPLDQQAALDVVMSRPRWREFYTELSDQIGESAKWTSLVEITVEKDGQTIAALKFEKRTGIRSVRNIGPGRYQLKLSTGRRLWMGELGDKDLRWTQVFPDQAVALAAADGQERESPACQWSLLGGEITLRIYPGLEKGRMEVEVKG